MLSNRNYMRGRDLDRSIEPYGKLAPLMRCYGSHMRSTASATTISTSNKRIGRNKTRSHIPAITVERENSPTEDIFISSESEHLPWYKFSIFHSFSSAFTH
jgi:hypothetical protein